MKVGIAQELVNGLSVAGVLILIALGLGITFGVMKVINMAHGELIMIGAYTMFVATKVANLSFYAGMILAFIVTALIGLVMEVTVIKRLYGRPLETLLATFGVSIILQQVIRIIFGTGGKAVSSPIEGTINMGGVVLPYFRLFIVVIGILVLIVTAFIMFKTKFGVQIRTVSQNRQMSECLGINTSRIDMYTFAFGSGLAGVAGGILAPIRTVSPTMGFDFLIDSFMVVVLGGVGSLLGTISGSLIIGEANQLLTTISSETGAKVLVFLIIIIAIRFRPQGLFGKETR
jgi:urea transport system permease protein